MRTLKVIFGDLLYGMRLLRKSPAFTIVAVLTLALGIGANTAIFSLLDQALLRKLPVKQADQLVLLRFSGRYFASRSFDRTDDHLYFSYPMYRDLRDKNTVLSGLLATAWAQVGVQWHNQPEVANAELVSGNYFDVLGVKPALGRLFVPSDETAPGASPLAVLSFHYWQTRFGLDPRVLNQTISINGRPFTIIGIAAPGFHSVVQGDDPAVFVPMMMNAEIRPGGDSLEVRRSQWLNIVGPLRPGISAQQAQASMDVLWHSIRAEEFSQIGGSQDYRNAFVNNSHLFLDDASKGVPMHGSTTTTLLVVMAMAALLALMACANVASLLLVRVAVRTREISVRYALGAGRWRIIRQLFSEGVLLGVAGGICGILVAPSISLLLIHKIWLHSGGQFAYSSALDLRILTFNFGLALLVSVLFSLAPAFQFWRPDVVPALNQQQATAVGGPLRLRRASVVAQISLSLLLLVGAGLFVRTLRNLRSQNLGFTTDHLITFTVDPRLAGYQENQAVALYQEILQRISALPGVRSVAATNDPELANNNWSSNITIAGYRPAGHEDMNIEWERVSSGYFGTLQMPLIAGRSITEQDRPGTQKVAVVNEEFAKHYFGKPQDALGRYFCGGAGNVKPDIEIVGVVANAKHTTLRSDISPTAFTPFLQEQQLGSVSFGLTFYVRTWQDPKTAEGTIRGAMHELDSNLVLDEFHTMHEQIQEALSDEQVIALLATSFGILAAFVAAIGIYSVLAYSTVQRTREIGIRLAIGASRIAIVRMILHELIWLLGIGLGLGLLLSVLATGALRSELFGVSRGDPLSLCVASLAIVVVALAAVALPARRAAKVDPMEALRYE